MTAWIKSREEFTALTTSLLPIATKAEEQVIALSTTKAFCRVCNKVTDMQVTLGEPEGHWRNLLEGMVCPCGLNARARFTLNVLDEILATSPSTRSVVFERLTPLFPHLAHRIHNLIGCEYLGDDYVGGTMVNYQGTAVRAETLLDLSFEDDSLDLVMHFDVLEHVPDWQRSLHECRRVLRVGGTLVFTTPFYNFLENNIVRAKIVNGNVMHLLPPGYHGNPVSNQGALVFIHPSWEVFRFLHELELRDIKLAVGFDPTEGIYTDGCPFPDGHVWPVAFSARK
jgi:SAM-dependent methyltransferase